MYLLHVKGLLEDIFTFRKKGLQYRVNRRDFYEGRNYLSNQSRLLNLFDNLRTPQEFRTEKNIRFYGFNFGRSRKAAIKHLGRPNYCFAKKSLLNNHCVLFYRVTLNKVKCVLQLHFIDDEFFLGIIETRSTGQAVQREIASLIRQKYKVSDSQWTGKIIDASNHSIEMTDGMIQRIIYLSGFTEHKQKIQAQIEKIKKIRQDHGMLRHEMILEMI